MQKIVFRQSKPNGVVNEYEFCLCDSMDDAILYKSNLENIVQSLTEYISAYNNFINYDRNVFSSTEFKEISKIYTTYRDQDIKYKSNLIEINIDRLFLSKQMGKLFEFKKIQYKYDTDEIKFIEEILPYYNYSIYIKPVENSIDKTYFNDITKKITTEKLNIVNDEYIIMDEYYKNNQLITQSESL